MTSCVRDTNRVATNRRGNSRKRRCSALAPALASAWAAVAPAGTVLTCHAFAGPPTNSFTGTQPARGAAAALLHATTSSGDPSSDSSAPTMWNVMDRTQRTSAEAFRAAFGPRGERGEYMDGYTPQAMRSRCRSDYGWPAPELSKACADEWYAGERADMMAGLFGEAGLWESTCMVAFGEHYVLARGGESIAGPLGAFRRQRDLRPPDKPIFCGVVLLNWEECDDAELQEKLAAYKERGIDYVRLHHDLGPASGIGPEFRGRFRRLAAAARACQEADMVPLMLLQVPWREPEGVSGACYKTAVYCLAGALREAGVEAGRLLLETRPPLGLSPEEERELNRAARLSLGLETGRKMFETITEAFAGDTVAGFCVAGGSTQGSNPTAMEDDVQNAVRQGIRQSALERWGYELCFWEMGAKLMLQPEVGRLWGEGQHEAARELFCSNAAALSEEIVQGIKQ